MQKPAVAMLQAVCMLACSYSRGLIGEYSVQEPSDVTTGDGMFSGTINPAGRFSDLLFASQPSSQSATFDQKRIPTEEAKNQDLISISAFSRFCQHTAMTNPVASIWALRHLVLAWTDISDAEEEAQSQNRGRVALEELSELARQQILRYVMVSTFLTP